MLWIAEIYGIVHVVLKIHGQMAVEVTTLLTHIRLIVILHSGACIIVGARLVRLWCTARFIRLRISFATQPVSRIGRLIFRTSTKSKYRNQLVVASCEAAIRLIELAMAHNHLGKEKHNFVMKLTVMKLFQICIWRKFPNKRFIWLGQNYTFMEFT